MSRERAAVPYRPPLSDVMLSLEVSGLDELLALEHFAGVDHELIASSLSELGRFAAEVIAPTDAPGDQEGARFDESSGRVTVPEPVASAYRSYVAGGWGALQFPTEHGGGGLPAVVGLAAQELLASASLSLSLNPVLTQSAIELLLEWGDAGQRARFVPRLITGEWCGTMNLTEPEAGSDLGAVTTRAEPAGDGTWHLFGTKIFITWGEHDLAENIVHLVLARTPGAPAGTRGLSLFLVPKRLLGPDGRPELPNALRCIGIEHKLGLHASPTCVMSYEGASAELVGPEGAGMRAMFTMMNRARLSIGAEGPAVAERAYQQALAYALERRQGKAGAIERAPIVAHPDVRRMLLTMRTTTLAARLLLFRAAVSGELARYAPDEGARRRARAEADLLTPVAKAWSTDRGFEAASLGVQVLGGMGYVEDVGMTQRLRDARIAPIYEGTNGIQAIDLVMRKLGRDEGAAIAAQLCAVSELLAAGADAPGGKALAPTLEALAEARAVLAETTRWLLERVERVPDDALAGASAYLELLGTTLGGYLLARRAALAAQSGEPGAAVAAGESNFFAGALLGRAAGLRRAVTAGAAAVAVPLSPSDPGLPTR